MGGVVLSIDTELTWRHHVAGFGWEENYALSIEPAGVGLSYQLEMLKRYGLKACFFVDPMPAKLFGLDPVKRMVETVIEGGQQVQLHLHPMWDKAKLDGSTVPDMVFELTDLDFNAQRAMISEARDLLVAAGAPQPTAFRSGSYAVNDDSLRALADIGIAIDSSHNGCEAPWPSGLDLPPDHVAPTRYLGVTELPVSQIRLANGGVRHLQICAVSLAEMSWALDHAAEQGHPVTTIVGHSFELATRGGGQANAVVKSRFDGLCKLLAERSERQPTLYYGMLKDVPCGLNLEPAAASMPLVASRMISQFWANLIERRAA